MSKIVLVRPKNDWLSQGIPSGLLHVGTILDEEGYAVSIIDATKQPDYKNIISREIIDASLVGITALTSEVGNAIEISDYIKKVDPDIPIIWGGWHPTLFPEQTCSDKSVDFVCTGEGEYTILEVVKALESRTSFENIDGLAYKHDGLVKINSQKSFVNMEELPPINYDLIDMAKYIKTGAGGRRIISYQSSRGCPHRCKFCINLVTGNRKYRMKSAKKVADEIEVLIDKYNINFVEFLDDNFFLNIKRAREICEEMIKRNLNIKWFAECRVDYFRPNSVDDNFLDLAVKSGLSSLTVGAESGSQRILNLLGKDITVEQILTSANMLSKYNIEPSYGFIIGIPDETKHEVTATIKLAQKITKICPKSKWAIVVLTPYPKCELTDDLIKRGFFEEPKILREWSNDNIRSLYTGRFSGKSWHRNPKRLQNISFFSYLGYKQYSNDTIKSNLKHPYIYPELFFILIAKIRMRYLFFGMPIDKFLYAAFKELRRRIFMKIQRIRGSDK